MNERPITIDKTGTMTLPKAVWAALQITFERRADGVKVILRCSHHYWG
jgi:hypothetical protein